MVDTKYKIVWIPSLKSLHSIDPFFWGWFGFIEMEEMDLLKLESFFWPSPKTYTQNPKLSHPALKKNS